MVDPRIICPGETFLPKEQWSFSANTQEGNSTCDISERERERGIFGAVGLFVMNGSRARKNLGLEVRG